MSETGQPENNGKKRIDEDVLKEMDSEQEIEVPRAQPGVREHIRKLLNEYEADRTETETGTSQGPYALPCTAHRRYCRCRLAVYRRVLNADNTVARNERPGCTQFRERKYT
jgi:hypothetical protein